MSDLAPKKLPDVNRSSALKYFLAQHEPFRTDLFASLTFCEPTSRLPEFGIVECRRIDDHQWLVKTEANRWYSVTLDEHSTRIIKPYIFRPLATEQEVNFLLQKAVQFAKHETSR